MATQSIQLYSHVKGPNPWKVATILEELGLPYETEFVNPAELHTPVYEKINPNGRVPAIHDPNTDITLWESGAIINYLMATYDKDNKLQPTGIKEKFEAQQWLFFQVSGQGPYFGQYTLFSFFHPEKISSAVDRYANEIKRVTKVLDTALEGKEYLVESKLTYADLSFVSWYQVITQFPGLRLEDFKETCPNFVNWMGKMFDRPAIKKVFEFKASLAAPK
ncbi:putative glutathione-s-transferase gst protein [Botrytis fragariae]|uniref:glutathione transferase n=1 Tax=Botrytis fragariae TaxID=1964551 RepID=A0A8H6B4L7_9HELO|nr:putative glutathione-s-transferase gst protein [Botrytis fragariae]KAF5879005.1 putative glutathione-s-transferase gst protein [Botrytis fragariae]